MERRRNIFLDIGFMNQIDKEVFAMRASSFCCLIPIECIVTV